MKGEVVRVVRVVREVKVVRVEIGRNIVEI